MARGTFDGTLIVDSAGRITPVTRSTDLPDPIRAVFIVLTLLLVWVHLDPFHDLTSVSNIEASDGGNRATQIAFSLLGVLTIGLLLKLGIERLRVLATRPLVLSAVWLGVSILFSVTPGLSFRRAILLGIMILASAAILVVARSARQFANLLAGTALVLVAVCFVSLVVVPDLAMHTALDLREPEHAGSWRGFFGHKNEAGSVMVAFILIGLFALRAGNRGLGLVLAVLAAIFLAGTRSKTALALLPVVLLATFMIRFTASRAMRSAILLGPLALILVMSVGTLFFPPAKALLASLTQDVTFTGRTDIWQFAIEHIQRRPITGWGYGAFWKTDATLYGSEATTWVNQADQAHNGYVDVALVMGLPGLALLCLLMVLQPLRDFQAATGRRPPDAASMFFLRVWLFALLSAGFESIFYEGNNSLSFLLMMSVFGMRFLATHGLAPAVSASRSRDGARPLPS